MLIIINIWRNKYLILFLHKNSINVPSEKFQFYRIFINLFSSLSHILVSICICRVLYRRRIKNIFNQYIFVFIFNEFYWMNRTHMKPKTTKNINIFKLKLSIKYNVCLCVYVYSVYFIRVNLRRSSYLC